MTDEKGGEAATNDEEIEAAAKAALSSPDKGGTGRDYESEAREQGWRPKEEWTGKPENWKDAKTYVESGDTASRLSRMEERIEKEVAARVAKLEKVTEASLKRIDRAHKEELAALKASRREAVKAGNVNLVDQYDAEIEKREEEAPLTDDPKKDRAAREQAFADANPWYGPNRKMTAFARGHSQDLANADPNLSWEDNIKQVLVAVREEFPEYYDKKPAANGHAAVDGGSENPGGRQRSGKSAADLPSEAKELGAMLVKSGAFKTIEDYAKEYHKNA